jgi:hypothetical protein
MHSALDRSMVTEDRFADTKYRRNAQPYAVIKLDFPPSSRATGCSESASDLPS